MANNSYTKNYADGSALTEAKLDTAYQSLKLDIGNTTQLTQGATAGQYLRCVTPGNAAQWTTIEANIIASSPTTNSAGSGVFNSATGFVAIPALSVTITTEGGPVALSLETFESTAATSTGLATMGIQRVTTSASVQLAYYRDGVRRFRYYLENTVNNSINYIQPGGCSVKDTSVVGIPGTYTYTCRVQVVAPAFYIQQIRLVAHEL